MSGLMDNWMNDGCSKSEPQLIHPLIHLSAYPAIWAGEVAEWSIAAVLKTASRFAGRGFESLPLRQWKTRLLD